MKITMKRCSYEKHLKTEVQYYPHAESFIRHVYKHIFDCREGAVWKRVLPLGDAHWKKLSRRKHLRNRGAGLEKDNEITDVTLQDCYDDLSTMLDRGINFADRTPLFTRLQEVYERPATGNSVTRDTYCLMSEHGLLIMIRNNVLRTAFFAMPQGGSSSFYDLFWNGMQKMLEDVQRVRSGKYWYHPDSGMRIHGVRAEQVRADNFSNALNPWPVTKSSLKGPKKTGRTAIEEIAYKYYGNG